MSSAKTCAPYIKFDTEVNTCFSYSALKELAKALNKQYPDAKINTNLPKKQLWITIYNEMSKPHRVENGKGCLNEWCWVDQSFIKELSSEWYDLENIFKPQLPRGKYQWLSNYDINMVMKQYEKVDPNFQFFGALPCDYFEINGPLPPLRKKKNGIVFNLDTSDGPGYHWVAVYIEDKNIEYFDSFGDPPIEKISEFMNMNRFRNYKKKINGIQHQINNSECGCYAMYFIINRMRGMTFENFTKNIIRDKEINQLRKELFFRPEI